MLTTHQHPKVHYIRVWIFTIVIINFCTFYKCLDTLQVFELEEQKNVFDMLINLHAYRLPPSILDLLLLSDNYFTMLLPWFELKGSTAGIPNSMLNINFWTKVRACTIEKETHNSKWCFTCWCSNAFLWVEDHHQTRVRDEHHKQRKELPGGAWI